MKEKDFNFWKRQLETLQNEKLMLLDLLSKQILHGKNLIALPSRLNSVLDVKKILII